MGRAELDYGRFISRLLVTIIPAAMASGIAVYVLYAIHVARAPNPADQLTLTSPLSDGLSTDERRELTRQMLKDRRENPQVPAEVRPTPRPPSNAATANAPVRAPDAKARPERTAATSPVAPMSATTGGAVQPVTAPLPTARPNAAAGRSDPAQVPPAAMGAVAPGAAPPVTPGAGAATLPPPATDPTTTPPAVVNTAPAGAEPEQRSFAGNVFSSISVFAGTAANATGNTVNWVIDLPGKAISAGGRLLGGGGGDTAAATPPPPPAAAPAPPPAAAPAPPAKRN
jgi:hypothetical protein